MFAGEWNAKGLRDRLRRASHVDGRSLNKFIRRLLKLFPDGPPRNHQQLGEFLQDGGNRKLFDRVSELFWSRSEMSPKDAAANWPIPARTTIVGLAQWLELPVRKLQWLADVQGRNTKNDDQPLDHYRCRWLRKPSGGWRLLEIPKATLKKIQRKILTEILNHVPPHDASHGFRKGRSVTSYVAPHVGQEVVLRFDFRDFFPSTPVGRVNALLQFLGYPPTVAGLLTGLCLTRMHPTTWQTRPDARTDGNDEKTRQLYSQRHLPQGSPTSPALANLCAYRLDIRLSKLASSLAAQYTRYADDIAISGTAELKRQARKLRVLIGVVAAEEGYTLNYRKCRVMPKSTRQHLAGVVVNEHANPKREDYDRLKATLTNCLRNVPATQNRENHPDFQKHLLGRIGWVQQLNPARGDKLRRLFDRIDWNREQAT